MRRISLVLIVAAAACWAASAAGAATFKGSVVGRDAQRGAIAVASSRGAVHTVRVAKLRSLGARVTVHAARRPDGTFRASRVSATGRTGRARIHGVVLRRAGSRTFLSAGGTVLSVRGMDDRARAGRVVTVDVSIRDDGLHGTKVVQAGAVGLIKIEGTIASLSPLKITLDHGATIQLTVPAALTLPAGLAAGDEVEAVVAFADGVYTLVTIEDDQQAEQGDDHGAEVEVHGTVTDIGTSTITITPHSGAPVVFAVPAGFDLSGVKVGASVEAKGVKQGGTLTLVRLKVDDENGDDDGGDDHGGHGGGDDGGHHGGGGHDGH